MADIEEGRELFKLRQYVTNPSSPAGCQASFSVVSYNILAECHRMRTDYSYTGEEFLCQGYRHGLLMKELQYLDGDVVCLQEVNPLYFNNTLLPDMKRLGYEGLMKCRTKEYYDEGAATFFRTSRFELHSSKEVSLTVSAHNAACIVEEVVAVSGTQGPHIICGDANSDSSSVVYQLITDGHLSESSVRSLQQVKALPLKDGHSKSLIDHLKDVIHHRSAGLKSSYSTVKGVEPELTCYTEKGWVLDYIFYSGKTLDVVGVLDMADTDLIVNTGGLPSKDFSSDHLSLKACFRFI